MEGSDIVDFAQMRNFLFVQCGPNPSVDQILQTYGTVHAVEKRF